MLVVMSMFGRGGGGWFELDVLCDNKGGDRG